MVKRIDKLTPEQRSRFAEWAKKWVDIGLSTEPADFDKATAAALKAYKLCNLEKPMIVLRCASPYAATLGGALAWKLLRELSNKKGFEGFPNVWDQVGDQVWAQVWAQVGDQVGAQVGDQVRAQVGDQVGAQVGAQVRAQNFQEAKDGYNNYGINNLWWASSAAWITYFRDVCGLEFSKMKDFEITEDLVNSCGWTWWHQNVLAISDRPKLIKRDDEGRLHCENGPSIAYRDGWSLYHWHGVSIPAEWVTGNKPTAKEALTWNNIEQRRAACEIVGWSQILEQTKAKLIDMDQNPEHGSLIEVDLPDSPKERFLQVKCATGRDFALRVDRKAKTVLEAQCWIKYRHFNTEKFSYPEITA